MPGNPQQQHKEQVKVPTHCTIMWFRNDLRVSDNPALYHASRKGPILPAFIWDESLSPAPGGAAKWWLAQSLEKLSRSLSILGTPLILGRGDPLELILRFGKITGGQTVAWNERTEPLARMQDEAISRELRERGWRVFVHPEDPFSFPTKIIGKNGPYRVFGPFWKHLRETLDPPEPLPVPPSIKAPDRIPPSDKIDEWGWIPTQPDWAQGLRETWTAGEESANRTLGQFLKHGLKGYATDRDRLDRSSVSRLSPFLHAGEISSMQVVRAVLDAIEPAPSSREGGEKFLQELGWRAFSRSLLTHFPTLEHNPFQMAFSHFPWNNDPEGLSAWKQGKTGYPIVDAGMRQLWHTGWIPNRIRMIVASFLTKDLLISWEEGARWFRDTLIDADLASNTVSWQWVAGCGVDAAPYFRIFNPVLQGETHDPEGHYVRRWVPELTLLPNRYIHRPWEALASVCEASGLIAEKTWTSPVVDHQEARKRALALFHSLKKSGAAPSPR